MQEANGQQLDKNPRTARKDEAVSKLSKSDKGSIKGDNQNHQYYCSHQHWHNATKDYQALLSTLSSGTLDSYLRAKRGSAELTS